MQKLCLKVFFSGTQFALPLNVLDVPTRTCIFTRKPQKKMCGWVGMAGWLPHALPRVDQSNFTNQRTPLTHFLSHPLSPATTSQTPTHSHMPHTVLQWLELVGHALAKDLPESAQPPDLEQRKQWPWWKVR